MKKTALPSSINPVGVIDLGSNSLRFAAFTAHDRALQPLFNEKEICEIGRGMENTGKLNPDGVALALKTLTRFKLLADGMGIPQITILATAAVREAIDGRSFLEEVRLQTGLTPKIISGEEEARLSADGVRFGIPDASGIMGDLGGGSLELAQLTGKTPSLASLTLGPIRLAEASEGRMTNAERIVNEALRRVDWMGAMHKRNFYAVGGIWRSIAKAHIREQNHPLNVVHMYNVDAAHMADYAQKLAAMSPAALGRIKGISRKRQDSIAYAALVLERVIAFGRPERIVFSATGLREGYLFSQLDEDVRKQDPLLSFAESTVRRFGAASLSHALPAWTARLWKDETPERARIRIAACEMSDLSWAEHPEYRALQAYQHALSLPVGGIDHTERCMLALALYVRHAGEAHRTQTAEALALLSPEQLQYATALGLVLRIAHGMTGGVASLLDGTSLKINMGPEGRELVLTLNARRESLLNDSVTRRHAAAAAALQAVPKIVFGRA